VLDYLCGGAARALIGFGGSYLLQVAVEPAGSGPRLGQDLGLSLIPLVKPHGYFPGRRTIQSRI
jgi:hypothetical protein